VSTERCIDLPQLRDNHGQLKDWIAGLEAARDQLEVLVKDLPVAALAWKPLSTAQCIGSLLLQIARGEAQLLGEGEKNLLEETEELQGSAPKKPLGWYLDYIRSVRASSLRALSKSPSLDHVFERRNDDGEIKRYTVRWALWHLLEQEAHHRGQIELLKQWYQQVHEPVYA
jgi:uncharacterized damage-inducible protein DinB